MIQNLFIFHVGATLLNMDFGKCHSLGPDIDLVSSYLFALQSIGKEITGTSISSMNFEDLSFHFFRDPHDSKIFYVIVSDIDDNQKKIQRSIHEIADLFYKRYSDELKNFKGQVNQFEDFKKYLCDIRIIKSKCEKECICDDCENHNNMSPIINDFRENYKKGMLSRLKSLISKVSN